LVGIECVLLTLRIQCKLQKPCVTLHTVRCCEARHLSEASSECLVPRCSEKTKHEPSIGAVHGWRPQIKVGLSQSLEECAAGDLQCPMRGSGVCEYIRIQRWRQAHRSEIGWESQCGLGVKLLLGCKQLDMRLRGNIKEHVRQALTSRAAEHRLLRDLVLQSRVRARGMWIM
jgi:hypothetical protein